MIWLFLAIIPLAVLIKYTRLTAPFVPTKKSDLQRVADLVKKYQATPLVDLGSGTGRVVRFLAKRFPEQKFTGVEIAPLLFTIAKFQGRKLANCQFRWGPLFSRTYSDFNAFFLFWVPSTIARNEEKLIKLWRPGNIVISYSFPILFLKDKLIEENRPPKTLPIYIYKI